jgi:hypothetical protein
MRILSWDRVRRELEGNAAFNMQLLRAIDPRLITHRPRDPEKSRLMQELGMEITVEAVEKGGKGRKRAGERRVVEKSKPGDRGTTKECDIDD